MAEQSFPEGSTRSESADERYRRLIETSRVGLFQTGMDGEILWVNQAAADIVGYPSPEEFVRAVPDIRRIYADPARRDEFLREIATSGQVSGFEYEIRRPDGSSRWISVSATPIVTEGSTSGFEGSVIDVTESRLIQAAADAISSDLKPEESVRRFAQVLGKVVPFHLLTLATIEGGRYRRLVSISDGLDDSALPVGEWVPLAGNPMERVVETKEPVVVQDTEVEQWGFDRRLRASGVGSYAVLPLMDDGEVFATFNVGIAHQGGLDDGLVSLLTKHTSAVAQAVKNILAYERERELAASLSELHRQRTQFFAEVSHDLRHPLVVVLGISQVLLSGWKTHDDDRKKELVEIVARNAQGMSELLQRDLEVALIESGELAYDIERFDLGTVIEQAVSSFRGSYPDRTIELDVPEQLPDALADQRRQAQILNNLLSNAVKFSPDGTPVRLEVIPGKREIDVAVIDEGPGIAPEDQPKLFRRLERLARSEPGSGLGLFVTHAMVEAQGGRIWVESTPGRGARFAYTVPVATD